MKLLVIEKDLVIDVSKFDSLRAMQGAAGTKKEDAAVAKQLLESGVRLTCDQPTLPTVAACAKQEAAGKGACKPISLR